MTNCFKFAQNSGSIIRSKLVTLLGCAYLFMIQVFLILSIPVYIFRVLVTKLAKHTRPDLGDILSGQSALLVYDYFEKTSPRMNVVGVLHCEGVITSEDIKNRIMNGLTKARDPSTGELLFDKMQQYPVKWLGFAFWKKAQDTFSIDNHVYKHSGKDTLFTKEHLRSYVEKLVNTRFAEKKSPWEFHVIENYQYEEDTLLKNHRESKKNKKHSVFFLKFHHSLTDGTGAMRILLEIVLGNYTFKKMKRPKAREIQRSFLKTFLFWLSFPVNAMVELSYIFSLNFRGYPWKIPDRKKKWNQVYATSKLIPINLIKEIKNTFGVSFTSVLLSAVSGAVEKSKPTDSSNNKKVSSTWPLFNVMQAQLGNRDKRKILDNHFAATIFDLPLTSFFSPVERLQAVHQALENSRNSAVPIIFQFFATVVGAHLLSVLNLLRNRQFPIALTNFAGTPEDVLVVDEHTKIVQMDVAVGGMSGDMGVCMALISHNGHVRINATAEEGLMTEFQVMEFGKHLNEEFERLHDLALMKQR